MQLPNRRFQVDPNSQIEGSVGLGATLGAAFEEQFVSNPIQTPIDTEALTVAREGRRSDSGLSIKEGGIRERIGPATPLVSIDEQASRIEEAGLTGQIETYEGETEEGLALRIQWRQDELARQSVFSASSDDAGTTALSFGAGLTASLFDPLNIAFGFVPVIGAGRYANMLANAGGRLGRFGVRARVGAAEGLVGAAALEPLVLAGADVRSQDYTLYDSALNLLLGSSLGGGLHGFGGAVSDAIRGPQALRNLDAISPEERVDAARAGVSSVLEGFRPDAVGAVVESALQARLRSSSSLSTGRIGVPADFLRGGSDETVNSIGPLGEADDVSGDGAGVVFLRTSETNNTPRRFDVRGDAEREAKQLRRSGENVRVRRQEDGFAGVEVAVRADTFLRDAEGQLITFSKRRVANKNLNRMRSQGEIEGGGVVPVRGVFALTTESNPLHRDAILANADALNIPDRLPQSPASEPQTDIRNTRSPSNALFYQQEQRLLDAIEEDIPEPDLEDGIANDNRSATSPDETDAPDPATDLPEEDRAELVQFDQLVEQATANSNALRQAAECVLRVA